MSSPSLFCSQERAFTGSSKATMHAAFINHRQMDVEIRANLHRIYGAMQGGLKENSKKTRPGLHERVELSTHLNLQFILSHPSQTTCWIRTVLPPLPRHASTT